MIDNKQFVYYNSVNNVIWGICNGSFKCDYFITDGVYDCVLRLSVQKDGTQRIVLYLCGNVRVRRKPLHDYGGILDDRNSLFDCFGGVLGDRFCDRYAADDRVLLRHGRLVQNDVYEHRADRLEGSFPSASARGRRFILRLV